MRGDAYVTPTDRVSFAAMLERLYSEKHTGPVVVHFAQGQPNVIEMPCEPVRISLDKGQKRVQA